MDIRPNIDVYVNWHNTGDTVLLSERRSTAAAAGSARGRVHRRARVLRDGRVDHQRVQAEGRFRRRAPGDAELRLAALRLAALRGAEQFAVRARVRRRLRLINRRLDS